MTDLDAIEKRAREAREFPGGLSATQTAALADDVLTLVDRLRRAEVVIDAARPLGASLFLDIRVSDEARFQVRRTVDAYDTFLAKREAP